MSSPFHSRRSFGSWICNLVMHCALFEQALQDQACIVLDRLEALLDE